MDPETRENGSGKMETMWSLSKFLFYNEINNKVSLKLYSQYPGIDFVSMVWDFQLALSDNLTYLTNENDFLKLYINAELYLLISLYFICLILSQVPNKRYIYLQ